MGGKATVIILNPDMTFREKKRRTDIDNVDIAKNNKPSFSLGRSVFHELLPTWKKWLLGKKERKLLLYLDGANSCFELKGKQTDLESHQSHIWSQKEKEKYINKLALKSKAEQKAIETWQFFLLAGIGIIGLIFQLLIMRGIRVL